ncbi:MAG TPA: BTAD domain-containing putative transcriptional regulator [Pseudonocardia sp.]
MRTDVVAALTPAVRRDELALHLIGGPYVVEAGCRRELPENSRRVLALVALRPEWLSRVTAAGRLWPGGDEHRAAGNLRSALWRMRGAGIDIIESDRSALRLRPDALVDLRLAEDWALRMIDGCPTSTDLATIGWQAHAFDLLPSWYDDWVVLERERLRQRMLHGLEAMSRLLVREARPAQAVKAAGLAVSTDPLRESAQRVLIEAHLASGQLTTARRCLHRYRAVLEAELGAAPSAELAALVG